MQLRETIAAEAWLKRMEEVWLKGDYQCDCDGRECEFRNPHCAIANLLQEISRIRLAIPEVDKAFCFFCGFSSSKENIEEMEKHLLSCHKHPLAIELRGMENRISEFETLLRLAADVPTRSLRKMIQYLQKS